MSNDLLAFLVDLDYPMTKEEILRAAEESDLSEQLRQMLQDLPERDYDTVAEVALATT